MLVHPQSTALRFGVVFLIRIILRSLIPPFDESLWTWMPWAILCDNRR
jgi:hypothetical protein